MSRRIVVRRDAAGDGVGPSTGSNSGLRSALRNLPAPRRINVTGEEPKPIVTLPTPIRSARRLPGGGMSVGLGSDCCLCIYGLYFELDQMRREYTLGIRYVLVPEAQMRSTVTPHDGLRVATASFPYELLHDPDLRGYSGAMTNIPVLVGILRQPVGHLLQIISAERPGGTAITDLHFDGRLESELQEQRDAAVIQATRVCLIQCARREYSF